MKSRPKTGRRQERTVGHAGHALQDGDDGNPDDGPPALNVEDEESDDEGDGALTDEDQTLGGDLGKHQLEGRDAGHPRPVEQSVSSLVDEGLTGQPDGEEKDDQDDQPRCHELRELRATLAVNGIAERKGKVAHDGRGIHRAVLEQRPRDVAKVIGERGDDGLSVLVVGEVQVDVDEAHVALVLLGVAALDDRFHQGPGKVGAEAQDAPGVALLRRFHRRRLRLELPQVQGRVGVQSRQVAARDVLEVAAFEVVAAVSKRRHLVVDHAQLQPRRRPPDGQAKDADLDGWQQEVEE